MSVSNDAPVVSEETFAAQSEALASGDPIVDEVEVEAIVPPAKVEEIEVEVEAPKVKAKTNGKTNGKKAKAVKPQKKLTVHKHWLIDIARHAKALGIHEGQQLVGTVRNKKGKKVLELVFID